MPPFLRALLAAVGVSVLTFILAGVVWDGGSPGAGFYQWIVPMYALLSAAVLAAAGAMTRGRMVRMLAVALGATVLGGVGIGLLTAGLTYSFGLGPAMWFATSMLGAGLLPGAAVFSRVYLAPARPSAEAG